MISTAKGRTINLDIEEAMLHGELMVYFQPIYDLQTTKPRLVQAEAFARWDHPDLGILSPSDLNIWDASERIRKQLTDYVLQGVLEQHVAWKKRGIEIPVSVNLPAAMLNNLEFPKRLARFMADHDVDHRLLYLEICEPRPVILPDTTQKIINQLIYDDFQIILDNFARNAVFLGELTRISWTGIKIDGGIIKDLFRAKKSRDLMSGIIQLAHELGLPVYAENVETEQCAAILKSLGCDKAQGWHFDMPMPSGSLTKLLLDSNGCSQI